MNSSVNCLVWLPHSYSGRGPAESCVRIIEHFPQANIETTVFTVRNRRSLPTGLEQVQALGPLLSRCPYRLVRDIGITRLKRLFAKAIDDAPVGTIVWFWPDADIELVQRAKARGLVAVREMINSPLAHAKPILDEAYRAAGLAPSHTVTDRLVEEESAELALYDYIFSSNAQVDAALVGAGIAADRILRTSFGWVAERFVDPEPDAPKHTDFRACFVGLISVRKGIPTLLEAWRKADIKGELVLAGAIEPCLAGLVEEHNGERGVRHVGFAEDVAALYRSSDVFVFPTHEEGGPQVTYEAAACGVPIITTDMGAARLVEHGQTGLVVPAGGVDSLAAALRNMAEDRALRRELSERAREAVPAFEYSRVGAARAAMLLEVMEQ